LAAKSGPRAAWIDPHGYDVSKKINSIRRHVLVDTQGLFSHAVVRSADIQDREWLRVADEPAIRVVSFLAETFFPTAGPKFKTGLKRV
jgi:hypothetical protein